MLGGERSSPESQDFVHSGQSTPIPSVVTVSTLNFVDLAGSERSSSSGLHDNEQRKRLKEVLSCLLCQLSVILFRAVT